MSLALLHQVGGMPGAPGATAQLLAGAGGIASHNVRITMVHPLNWPRCAGGGIGADPEDRGRELTVAEVLVNNC